jgi:hypothetical protein
VPMIMIMASGALTLALVSLSGLSLLGDGWLKPGLRGIAIPFAAPLPHGVHRRRGHSAFPRSDLTVEDLDQALNAAEVIGDNYIQQAAGHVIDSALWTHGSSEQRQYWVTLGYQSGRPSACDTFASRNHPFVKRGRAVSS